MTALEFSQSRTRARIWLALAASLLLHGAAVAVANLHRQETPANLGAAQNFPEVWVEPVTDPVAASPEIPDLPPPPLPDDPPHFSDVPAEPTSPRLTKSSRITKPPTARSGGLRSSSAKALALHAPLPDYPYEARRARITGDGVAILTLDPASGRVLEVTMTRSTGSAILDQAAIDGLRRWRFRAGTAASVRCPITYTLTGAMF